MSRRGYILRLAAGMARQSRVRCHITCLLVAAVAIPAFALDNASWSNLGDLKPGTRIGVIQSDGKRFEGRFENFTEADISLQVDRRIRVPKDHVIRVYRRPLAHRTLRAAIGAAIGAAGGAVLSASVGTRFRNEGMDLPDGPFIGGGIAIGAAIGAVTGGNYRTVYQRASH